MTNINWLRSDSRYNFDVNGFAPPAYMKIIGQSARFQEILRTVELVAVTDVPVLLTGETGTGKKYLASRIHQLSKRSSHCLTSVNCSALPDEFTDSMLSGCVSSHGQTDSSQNLGYIAKAGPGTLFLDEISALSESQQNCLLHFIETENVHATGDLAPRQHDVRLIVASSKNLRDEVAAGNFRADLFYRLNVIPVEMPALREREGDVSVLMEYFFHESVRQHHRAAPGFTRAALKQINKYDWPGNVRELENFCERMFMLFGGKEVDITNLPRELRSYESATIHSISPFSLPASGIQLDRVEVGFIQQALQTSNGNKSRAARLLGLTRDTFLYRLKKYSIKA